MIDAAPQAAPAAAAPQDPPGYHRVWSDDFTPSGAGRRPYDRRNWRPDTSANKTGWYNDEAQYYSAETGADRHANAWLETTDDGRGVLVIEARREQRPDAADWGRQDYTSARLNSTASWTYGRYEISARLPCGRGTWPAIWMMPTERPGHTVAPWPHAGELDIMEQVGFDPEIVHGTVHTGAYNHVMNTQKGGQTPVPDACDAFHRYGLTWTPDRIVFTVDDVAYQTFDNDHTNNPETWPFDAPFHLILNQAIGGGWGGREGIDDAALPRRMEVDYVRVWAPD